MQKMGVNDPAVIRIQRRQLCGLPGVEDPLGQTLRFLNELILIHRSMMVHIDPDPRRRLIPGLEDAIDEVLNIIHPIPFLAREKFAFRRENMKARLGSRLVNLIGGDESEIAQQGVQNLLSDRHVVHAQIITESARLVKAKIPMT